MTEVMYRKLGDRFSQRVIIHAGMKVDFLKREIAIKFNVPSKRVLLFFNGQYFHENCNLDRYNFRRHDEILVMIKPLELEIFRVRPIGVVPGIEVGMTFSREQLFRSGLHRENQRGIYAHPNERAYSIILSGRYNDMDLGGLILYIGERSRNPQELTMANNTRALAKNCHADLDEKYGAVATTWYKGYPVRVFRKIEDTTIYRYDGIYKVVMYGPGIDEDRNIDWYFLLIRDFYDTRTIDYTFH